MSRLLCQLSYLAMSLPFIPAGADFVNTRRYRTEMASAAPGNNPAIAGSQYALYRMKAHSYTRAAKRKPAGGRNPAYSD